MSQTLPVVNGQRAAQYLRMSTEFQRYSLENQAAGIAAYAAARQLKIVKTYLDKGRSGLHFDNRNGLTALVDDIQGKEAEFGIVLVYDVSRWGRFQDVDESAYYEFLCRRAGVKVLYCAEQFENDGSFVSAIMKNIKRVAAGDYSRELSAKVFAGSCRIVQLGFKPGGVAGYGLERVLVDQFGSERCVLAPGERKLLMTDRVLLRPGPPEAVKTVRWIFRSFVHKRKTETEIARELNARGVLNQVGRPWTLHTIRRLLLCDNYIGNFVYNRRSGKLRGKRTANPPEQWIRCESAIKAIIDPVLFEKAGALIEGRPRRTLRAWKSNGEMLRLLRELLERKGRLTCSLIEGAANLPCGMTYIERFGSLRRAYELIGYRPDTFKVYDSRRAAVVSRTKLGNTLLSAIQCEGRSVSFDARSGVLTIPPALTVSMLIVRCNQSGTGSIRWPIRRRLNRDTRFNLLVRMQEDNESFLDYFLLPNHQTLGRQLNFRKHNQSRLQPYRLTAIESIANALMALSQAESAGGQGKEASR